MRLSYPKEGARCLGQRRGVAISRTLLSNFQQHQLGSPISKEQDALNAEDAVANAKQAHEAADLTPWYLQVDPPQRASNPLLERQQLPPLPPDPPPLLKPMLEQISIDLGLDDLTLFDLRSLDPPPALGANLLMVIGTARSEKHLHVSAERFCRWLKATHKLSPHADGLLGRGELKLKLRRKARRAKLLSNVGSSETRITDDGIRTGWICVNVGIIQDGREAIGDRSGQQGYVGFGSEAEGAKVVVQMLTQEKREELDLEDLWGKMLQRHERKESRTSIDQKELQVDQRPGESSLSEQRPDPESPFLTYPRALKHPVLGKSINNMQTQRRFISSSAVDDPSSNTDHDDSTAGSLHQQTEKVRAVVSMPQGHILPSLQSHIKFLKALARPFAIKALGRDSFDVDSTIFLESFYGTYPHTPEAAHWECHLALVARAIEIGHSGYTKSRLAELLHEMQSSVVPEQRVFELVFQTLLIPNYEKKIKYRVSTLTKESLRGALVTLDAMHSHGYDIETLDIRQRLQLAVKRALRPRGKIRPGDPDRLKQLLDDLHARLHNSPGYVICLRMLIECCEELPKGPNNPLYQDPHPDLEAAHTSDHAQEAHSNP